MTRGRSSRGCDTCAKDGRELQVTTRRRGQRFEVTFRDRGAGIPEEDLTHIFRPFFTTKHCWAGHLSSSPLTFARMVMGVPLLTVSTWEKRPLCQVFAQREPANATRSSVTTKA